MKILHVSSMYFPAIGGSQKHSQDLSEELVRLGEEVHVFTTEALNVTNLGSVFPGNKQLPSYEIINGVHVRRFKINYFLHNFLFNKLIKLRGGYRLLKLLFGPALEFRKNGPLVSHLPQAIRQLKPDIVTAFTNSSFLTYLCHKACRRCGIPLIIIPITHLSEPWIHHPFLLKILSQCNGVIACTEFERKFLTGKGIPKDKVHTLPLGNNSQEYINKDALTLRRKLNLETDPVISYIGRKVKGKGIDTLIAAMPSVWKEYPQTRLLLVGQRSEYFDNVLLPQIRQLPASQKDKVIVIDAFGEKEKYDYYAVSDIVIMTSCVDCFGLVYLEAWLCGKPVIACHNYPQESIIDDMINGCLTEYGDPGQLAQTIARLLADPGLREKMGKAGKEKVEKQYNLRTYAQNIRLLYRRVQDRPL